MMPGPLLLLVVVGAASAPVVGAASAPVRSPDDILGDYARAVGADGWKGHKTLRIKSELFANSMQLRGTMERFATASDKLLSVTTIPGMGSFRQGSTGRVRWSEDPINGLRILAGAEDEEARIEATWNADLQLKKLFPNMRAVPPPVPPDGKTAGDTLECVELKAKIGTPVVICFDGKTHLRVLQKGTHATPQGEVPYVSRFSDWREVKGVKVAFKEELTAGPMTLESTTVEVVFDEPMRDTLFRMPKPGVKDRAQGKMGKQANR